MEEVGLRIDKAKEAYETLSTTRRHQLDRQFKKIEDLRQDKGIALEGPDAVSQQ